MPTLTTCICRGFLLEQEQRGRLRKSLDFFERSLEKDPGNATAWTGIAKVWLWLADAYVRPLDAYPQMKAAAQKALSLDESDADATCLHGRGQAVLDYDPRRRRRRVAAGRWRWIRTRARRTCSSGCCAVRRATRTKGWRR
jgi:tetratricopeptide (TPR) repeat protein